MTKLQKQKHDARVVARLKELPSLAPTTPHPMSNEDFLNKLVADKRKQSVKKLNAKNFFIELIHSLAPGKDLTPTQRSQYKRVLAFLEA